VPVLDLLLAQAPAEEHVLFRSARGEVDQTGVGVLDDGTELVDAVHATRDATELFGRALVERGYAPWVDAAAVAGDRGRDLCALRPGVPQRLPVCDETFDERADRRQEGVGLLDRESGGRHRAMIGNDVTAGQRLAEIDAVTIDAFGTLLELRDPVESLARLLPGFERDAIDRAFRAEAEYYSANAVRGRDDASLAELHDDCTRTFNEHLGSSLSPTEYLTAFDYRWIDGAREAVGQLRALGLALAVVADWDISVKARLDGLGIPIVTSAETGTRKPDPSAFLQALAVLGVPPERAVHVGDTTRDEQGAAAAGMRFAPAPLIEAVASWT
jgi:HAD superfamily hydrolase (TIGR01509 family)